MELQPSLTRAAGAGLGVVVAPLGALRAGHPVRDAAVMAQSMVAGQARAFVMSDPEAAADRVRAAVAAVLAAQASYQQMIAFAREALPLQAQMPVPAAVPQPPAPRLPTDREVTGGTAARSP